MAFHTSHHAFLHRNLSSLSLGALLELSFQPVLYMVLILGFSVFCFSFPAIYNYNASQDVELSLQVGDTVHILEMYEGKSGWPSARWVGRPEQCELLTHKVLGANINTVYFLK